jgi:putative ABC transport system substrate-binding protein
LGHVEGRNLTVATRFAEEQLDRLPVLAAELVAWRPDVIFTHTSRAAQAAADATRSIPIVVGPAGEQVLMALAKNQAHPAGNVTGITLEGSEQYEKCLELLVELSPHISRVGVLLNPDNTAWAQYPAILGPATSRLGLVLVRAVSRGAADIEDGLAKLDAESLDALLVVNDSVFFLDAPTRSRIVAFARSRHLPSASTSLNWPKHGGLLGLGADMDLIHRRAADYVHRIIQGERPGDLPVERPARLRLSVNLETAKAIGVTIPPMVLGRADEVIE